MDNYKHIILAVDLHPNCDETTTDHAIRLVKDHGAKFSIVYAIEHINAYGIAQAYPTVFELEQQLLSEARTQLERMRNRLGIPDAEIKLAIGSPKIVILDYAKEVNADLIIVGSHGRHGISLLLGSTANAVLHHAPCDVLAVRVKDHTA